MSWNVYILECCDKSYYVGITPSIKHRIAEHENGECHFTNSRLPRKWVYKEEYPFGEAAVKREKQVKGWSRSKKENLINGIWKKL